MKAWIKFKATVLVIGFLIYMVASVFLIESAKGGLL